MASCPSCRAGASTGMRSCSQCGFRFTGASSVLSTHAVGSSATSAGISRRNIPKDRNKKKKSKDKDKEREKSKENDTERDESKDKEKIDIPSAAAGEEAAFIYKRMLAAVRGANKDHDEVVSAFKADCKQFGQGELRARVFYERLSTYFGSELMLEHMLPQLARLIPDDKKRKKLVKVHVKSKRVGGVTALSSGVGSGASSHARRPVSSSGVAPMRPSGDRRPYSASELIRRDSIESDTSSNTSGELVPAPSTAPASRLTMNRYADNPKCAICSEVFEIKRRRHHCRKCGASVCHSCSPARMLISPDQVAHESMKKKYDPAHPQRVCTICAPILQCFQDGLNTQYANCHKENPHEAKSRLHLPFSRSLESACRSAADILGNFFRPDFGADSDRYIPVNFLKRAQGIAFLTVIKAGLLITAKMGTGIVIAKLDDDSWSAPSAIGTAGIGGGLEGGGELIEFMIIMGSKNAVKVFHRTQVNVGGGLSVAVGPYGRDAVAQAAASRGGFNANYSYSHSRGLFAGISLHGAVITARTEMNSNFYGQKLTPEEILSGAVPHPRAAQCLYDAIDQAMEGIAQFESSGGSQRCASAATAPPGPCSSCRCQEFISKAFSKKCKTCAHVHNTA
ncbi:Las17-binding protein actin regulator [Phytophthora infestans]|uniref:Las17-binding protein actin regulator n=1 Tax=Phytophthora infestans TaxID=4787 RepID=A0A8S9TSS4_PHYIN|nr:Las17-binding protein actin regulator [Phytophthora infestans]